MYRILVLTLDGVVDSSLALTLDAAATANRIRVAQGKGVVFETELFSPGRKRIRTGMGATYPVRGEVQLRRYDAIVIPGLGLTTPEEVVTCLTRKQSRHALNWLRIFGARCPLVAASCSAVFLLAEAGLLEGHKATTSWWMSAAFRERYPGIELDESRMTIESEGVITAGAALAQMDLMLHLIARAEGPSLSHDVSKYLAIDRRPSQARFMMLSAIAGVPKEVREVDRWIRSNLSRSFSVTELASGLGMSARTLDRKVRAATGSGASRLIQAIRVEHAAHLIETSDSSLADIATEVGYADVSTLRRLLRRSLGANPSELKRARGSVAS